MSYILTIKKNNGSNHFDVDHHMPGRPSHSSVSIAPLRSTYIPHMIFWQISVYFNIYRSQIKNIILDRVKNVGHLMKSKKY